MGLRFQDVASEIDDSIEGQTRIRASIKGEPFGDGEDGVRGAGRENDVRKGGFSFQDMRKCGQTVGRAVVVDASGVDHQIGVRGRVGDRTVCMVDRGFRPRGPLRRGKRAS